MRVLVMSHAYVPHTGAGAETTLHDLLRAVVEAGHQVDVLLSENRGAREVYEVDGVRVHPHVDTGDPFRWFGTERGPDVVVTQLGDARRAGVLCHLHKVPMVQVVHNEQLHTRHSLRLGPADLVVYNAEWVRRAVVDWFWACDLAMPERQMVVHPPVRAEQYRLPGGPGDHVTMINMAPVKGPGTFYEMARRFPGRKFLAVVGCYGEQQLQELPNVEIVGPFAPADMRGQVYAWTKVLLVPSDYETYGRVAVEACCAGIPVIASTSPGLPEALGEHGTCIDREDHDGWEVELRRVLSPRGWSAAARRAKAVADGLDTAADLARWVKELEAVAR